MYYCWPVCIPTVKNASAGTVAVSASSRSPAMYTWPTTPCRQAPPSCLAIRDLWLCGWNLTDSYPLRLYDGNNRTQVTVVTDVALSGIYLPIQTLPVRPGPTSLTISLDGLGCMVGTVIDCALVQEDGKDCSSFLDYCTPSYDGASSIPSPAPLSASEREPHFLGVPCPLPTEPHTLPSLLRIPKKSKLQVAPATQTEV